jgi:DNA-binding MarR family transcriptional regulator
LFTAVLKVICGIQVSLGAVFHALSTERIELASPRDLLHPEWIVLRAIAKAGEKGIHVSALANELDNEMSKVTVIRALAKLEQRQMVRAEWIKDTSWKRKYFIANKRIERLVSSRLEPLFTTSREGA